MKKNLFKIISTLLVLFVFSVSISFSTESIEPTLYKVDFINKTDNITIGIMCILPVGLSEECLHGDIVLFPKNELGKCSKVTVDLKRGRYFLILASADKETKEIERHELMFDVEKDGEIIFDNE